jgi:hypothetical protein
MKQLSMALTLLATVALASPAAAQGRGRGNDGVPPGHRPPAGLCRVWVDGVPPGHQPAPTNCATAEANRTYNSRVIYGDSRYDQGKAKKAKKNTRWTRIDGRLCEVKDGKDGRVTYRCEGDRSTRDPYWDRSSRRGDDDRDRDGGVRTDTRDTRDGRVQPSTKSKDPFKIYGRRG